MKKQLKFLLFAILMLTLVMMTMICVSAAADGDTEQADEHYFEVQDKDGNTLGYYINLGSGTSGEAGGAWAAVPEGGKLIALKNLTYASAGTNVYLYNSNNFTFEGAGYTIKNVVLNIYNDVNSGTASNTLRFNNVTIDAASKCPFVAVNHGSTFEFTATEFLTTGSYGMALRATNATYNFRGTANVMQGCSRGFSVEKASTIYIEGGTYSTLSGKGALLYASMTGKILFTAKAGSFTGGTHAFQVTSSTDTDINIYGGTWACANASQFFYPNNCTMDIVIGEENATNSGISITGGASVIYAAGTSNVHFTLNDGSVTTTNGHMFRTTGTGVTGFYVTFNGGVVTPLSGKNLFFVGNHANNKITVNGGVIDASALYFGGTYNWEITGGTINSTANFYNANMIYTVTGGTFNLGTAPTTEQANTMGIANAESVTLPLTVTVTQSITITSAADLAMFNSDNYWGANAHVNNLSCTVAEGVKLTVNGGTYANAKGSIFVLNENASMDIQGGTFTHSYTSTSAVVYTASTGTNVTVSGETKMSAKHSVFYVTAAGTMTLTISGGDFSTTNQAVLYAYGEVVANVTGGTFKHTADNMPIFLMCKADGAKSSLSVANATLSCNRGIVVASTYSALPITLDNVTWTSAGAASAKSFLQVQAVANATVEIKNSTIVATYFIYIDGTGNVSVDMQNTILVMPDGSENFANAANDNLTLTYADFTLLIPEAATVYGDIVVNEYAPAVKFGGESYLVYMTTEGAAINKAGAEIYMGLDEQGNLVDGIRFTSELSADVIALAKAALDADKTVSYGMIIAPADYVVAAGTFTKAALDEAFGSTNGVLASGKNTYVDVPAVNSKRDANNDGVCESFSAMLINIKEANYTRAFAAVGYVVIDGEIIYSAYNTSDNARSAQYVATALLESGYYEGEDDMIAILNKYAGVAAE